MKYQQLTLEERVLISHRLGQGLNQAEVVRALGRLLGTISRELRRNTCGLYDQSYRYSRAHKKTIARRRRSRRNRHYTDRDLTLVRQLLRQHLSPEQIVGHIRRFGLMQRRISHETIYQYVWRDKAAGGLLWRHLRQASKRRRKRYNAYERETAKFKTITADNGTEFHQYPEIEEATGVRFYFATPHHSWERGTNENTNGLIRQYVPKGMSMKNLTQAQCDRIAERINTRPRKRHNYKTPEEVLYG